MRTETVFATLVGATIGGVLLFLAGAFVGGNLATNFEFARLRGYEALGVLGGLVGLVGGSALGALLVRMRAGP